MEHIDGIFYINLDRRTDRRAEFEEECRRMEFEAERFPAIEDSVGFIGCHKSHLAVLTIARERGLKNILIFEDDFKFVVEKDTFENSLRAFFNSGTSYDVLMLSYNIAKQEQFNDLVSLAKEAQTASGYIVHQDFYDKLIGNLESNLQKLIATHQHWNYLNDQCWKQLQPDAKWFFFNKRIGIQRPSFSDLSNRFAEYNV
jgi:glycosyl transferase family 25